MCDNHHTIWWYRGVQYIDKKYWLSIYQHFFENINIDKVIPENIDIDKAILENIDIDKIILDNIDRWGQSWKY